MSETITRRQLLCVVAGCAAASACRDVTHTSFFRKRFSELSPDDLLRITRDLETSLADEYGKEVAVGLQPPRPGVEFAYGLDLSRCVGCRRCVYGCVEENNQSRDPELHWIRVLQMEQEKGIDFAHADPYYDPDEVPEEGHFYLPVACQQCRNAPCVKTCPVGATWQEPDGIVVIDYDWCIGCRCCISA
jgi:molybdopterin-containing oxidoreductase family iron-sulfur binding subunit